jgi:hypothetical protein
MKFLLLLLISLTCLASEPKFHFQDCVEITHGFYQGCKGTVEDMQSDSSSYAIKAEDCRGGNFYDWFKESDLKLSKGCV